MTKQGFIDLLVDEGWDWKEVNQGFEILKDEADYYLPYSAIEVMGYEYALNKLVNGLEVVNDKIRTY